MALGFEEYQRRHRAAQRKSARTTYLVIRMEAAEAYGNACIECGQTCYNGFEIIPRGGRFWRDLVPDPPPQGARNKYAWLKRHGYPDTFVLVCGPACRARVRTGR